jgi:hypothetical protein
MLKDPASHSRAGSPYNVDLFSASLRLFLEFAFDHTASLDRDALETHLAIHHGTAANGQVTAIQKSYP